MSFTVNLGVSLEIGGSIEQEQTEATGLVVLDLSAKSFPLFAIFSLLLLLGGSDKGDKLI